MTPNEIRYAFAKETLFTCDSEKDVLKALSSFGHGPVPISPVVTEWECQPRMCACYWNALHYLTLHTKSEYVLAVARFPNSSDYFQHALVKENGQHLEISYTPFAVNDYHGNNPEDCLYDYDNPEPDPYDSEIKMWSLAEIPASVVFDYYKTNISYYNATGAKSVDLLKLTTKEKYLNVAGLAFKITFGGYGIKARNGKELRLPLKENFVMEINPATELVAA